MTLRKPIIAILFLLLLLGSGCNSNKKSASRSDIEAAKAAVGELRNWATQVRALQSAEQQSELEIKQSLAITGTQIAYDTVADSLTFGVDAIVRAYQLNGGADGSYPLLDYINLNYFPPTLFPGGNLIFPPDPTGEIVIDNATGTASITDGTIYEDTVNIVISLPASTVAKTFDVNVVSASVTNSQAFAQIDKGTITMSYAEAVDLANPIDPVALPDSASMSLIATVGQLESEFENAVKFSGEFTAAARVQTEYRLEMNPEHILLSGTFSNEKGESLSGTFEAYMRNAATFNPVPESLSGLPVAGVISYYFSNNGNTLTINYTSGIVDTFEYDPIAGTVKINGFPEFSNTVYNSFDLFLSQNYRTSGRGYDYAFDQTTGNFIDYYFDYPLVYDTTASVDQPVTVDGFISYSDVSSETPDSWRDIDGSISFSAKFDGLPEAKITIEVDVLDYQKVAGKLTISYDNVLIELSLDNSNFKRDIYGGYTIVDAELVVTVTDSIGKIVLTVTATPREEIIDVGGGFTITEVVYDGEIYVNGNLVAKVVEDVAPNTLIVNYENGEFESLVY